MRISVLGSGSGGNCTFVATEKTAILIDQGFGPRSLERRLKDAGLQDHRIDAILLTHGHSDHTRGAVPVAEKLEIPIFMNEGTRAEVPELGEIDRWEPFETGKPFTVGDLSVEAFDISHDAAQPVGFRIHAEGLHGALATDLGELTPAVAAKLVRCDWLVLESNHDEEMLKIGRYPWALKQRVMGRNGHLSNSALARFLGGVFDGYARHLFLAHLSRENNDPEIAFKSASGALFRRRFALLESCKLHLTDQIKPTIVLGL